MANKYLEKLASIAGMVAGARRMAGSAVKAVKSYAADIPADAQRLGRNIKNIKAIKNTSGMSGVAKTILGNKAVQTGAGVATGGYLLGKAMSKKNDK